MVNWALLEAYYEENMKSNFDKASPFSKHSKIFMSLAVKSFI